MRRALAAAVVLLTAAGLTAVPSEAAPRKKPKPISRGYAVQLPPDPTANVLSTAGQGGLCGLNEAAQHRHAFKAPAAGTLRLRLKAEDPAPGTPFVFDWDIYVLDAAGDPIAEGTSTNAVEDVGVKLKKAQQLVFLTCNLNGLPDATVAYTFTYR